MSLDLKQLSMLLDEEIIDSRYLTQGQIGDIYRVSTATRELVVKSSERLGQLSIEARMLQDLADEGIRVPEVVACDDQMLAMEWIEQCALPREIEETEAAKSIAALHSVSNDARMYGYWYDTTIASFPQHNEQTQYNWGLFLGQMRIMPMAEICYERGYLDRATMQRLERLSRDIYKLIDMSQITPSLLHGDLWSGNILFAHAGAVLIDPAIYFGDKEMDLAFLRMFDTFGDTFWETYERVHPLSDDFETVKVPLYQLYPILVHIALYGEQYRGHLEKNLRILKQ